MNKDNKKLVVESKFIKESLKKDLSLTEFLLLLYFDNSFDASFDIKLISKILNMDEKKILEAYTNLLSKQIINIDIVKNEAGKMSEVVNIENFYNDILLDTQEIEKTNKKDDVFSAFESEMGRSLSPTDFELINAWLDSGYSEELIIAALKEAVYNGALSLRYIDKILYEWNKKGFKTEEDINNHLQSEEDATLYETKVLDFNWLDEN